MVALATVVNMVTDGTDTERKDAAAQPAANAHAAHAGQVLNLRTLLFDVGVTAVLTHRAKHILGVVVLLEFFQVVVVFFRLHQLL